MKMNNFSFVYDIIHLIIVVEVVLRRSIIEWGKKIQKFEKIFFLFGWLKFGTKGDLISFKCVEHENLKPEF